MTRKLLFALSALLLLLFAGAGHADAQQKKKFSVESFGLDQFDGTAKNEKYKKTDSNGSLYAIIKVTSNNPDDNLQDYRFNFGYLNHEVAEHDGELWVYVQRNAKHVTISRAGYATINKYDLRTTIEAGKTYAMQLSVTAAPVFSQMTAFAIEPASAKAVVMIKSSKADAHEELFGNADNTGGVAKSLPYGSYTYRVMAENYHSSEGQFTLNDKTKTHTERVTLRPAFSEVTLRVDADADIYVNGEKRGNRSWTGILKAGNYQVECQQARHRNSTQFITVEENNNRTYELAKPTPITGTLAVVSRPLGATITIDGKDHGLTPQNVNNLIIGQHTVTLSLKNYKSETRRVDIEENKTTDLDVQLSDMARMTISSKPAGAVLFIDGRQVGTTPYTEEMASGDYEVKMTHPKYQVFQKRIHLDSSSPSADFTLSRQYLHPTSFYIEGNLQAGTMTGLGGTLGAYLSNVNIEGFLTTALGKETLFLNHTDGSEPTEESLSGLAVGGRLGYGIILGTRMRLTPQIGLAALSAKGSIIEGSALCATAGVRLEYAMLSNLGISLTPEGRFAVSKKDVFNTISALSTKVKGWGAGFNARLGVYLYF